MGNLHKWFSGSKSKDGKSGWVNVKTGGTCASDEPGEGTPKCVSSSKRDSMTKSERESASRRKKAADPGQQQKSGAAKPTYVSTDKPKKMKKEQFSNWRDNTPEPMVNELFGLGKKKENKNRGAGGSWETSTSEARARSRGWKDPNEKPKPMSPFGPEKGTSKSPDKFKNVKKTLGIRPKPEPKATSQTKPEPKATSQTKTDPTPKSNPYSGKDKLKPQSFSTAVRSGTKMNKSTPSAPGKIVTQQGNQKEQFSNWRDNYVATEHEFIDLIKPEPMVGISEEDKKGSGSGKKDACYKKVKASASVWPSAYASGRLVQCRKKGADNYGNSTKKEDVEQIDEVSKELATKAYAERRTNEVEADELHTKSDKTRNRIVKKYGEKAGKDADKAVDKKLYGESIVDAYVSIYEKKLDPVGQEDGDIDNDGDKDSSDKYLAKRRKAISKSMKNEAIDPKGAARMDAAKGKKKETQDQIDKRLMLGKYSPAVRYGKMKKEEIETEGFIPIDKAKQTKIDRQIGRSADKEAIEQGKSKKYGRDEKKIDKEYQRQQAMRFGKKMKKEGVEFSETELKAFEEIVNSWED